MLTKKIEAVLYTLGKFTTAEEIAKIVECSKEEVLKSLEYLKQKYEKEDSSLTIQTVEDRFKLNVKKEFSHIASKLLSDAEMDTPTTNTLAIIAFKSPVTQSEVIKIRGNKAYDHIHQLEETNLVSSEKCGRTKLLKLTSHFYDYFDVAEKEVKQQFEQVKQKAEDKNNKMAQTDNNQSIQEKTIEDLSVNNQSIQKTEIDKDLSINNQEKNASH